MNTPDESPLDATDTSLDLAKRFKKAVQDFYQAYPLDDRQKADMERNVQPYVATLADAFFAGIFYDDSERWITYLNSSAYSAMRISMVLSSYRIEEADTNRLRDCAVELAQQIVEFAERQSFNLYQRRKPWSPGGI